VAAITRRFRTNVLIGVEGTGWPEDEWAGRTLSIGAAVLVPLQPCIRCTMVTRAQPGLEADADVLRTLARHHRGLFGVWCDVLTGGTLSVGEEATFVGRQVLSWRHSSGERRQQLKWLASGAAVTIVSTVVAAPLAAASPRLGWLHDLLWCGLAALPVSMGVAILRYRLYEIDRIISRTLAYAIVTGLLVGVYAGLVLLTTQVLRFHDQVAVAASTLIAAALFSPLRRRVQRVVDRHFNRARYDADLTVAAFAARLQDAVDLDAIAADLVGVVETALEPRTARYGRPNAALMARTPSGRRHHDEDAGPPPTPRRDQLA
jgi:hypothetical protein